MTHTEQFKELQKAVWASLSSQITHAINCTDLEHEEQDSCEDFTKKNFEQLMQLITADRKRVALEARIDELRKMSDLPYVGLRGKRIERLSDRAAELKAQQEEV